MHCLSVSGVRKGEGEGEEDEEGKEKGVLLVRRGYLRSRPWFLGLRVIVGGLLL